MLLRRLEPSTPSFGYRATSYLNVAEIRPSRCKSALFG